MLTTVQVQFWDDLLDPLKVTFDGDNRKIYLNTQYATIRVKQDMYSAMKRWLKRRQNLTYPVPIRTVGGDPLGGGLYAGDLYFLTNDWQVMVQHQVAVIGTLYNDNVAQSTYNVSSGGGVVATVAALAYAYTADIGFTEQSITDAILNTPISTQSNTATVGGAIAATKATTQTILSVSV